MKLLQLSAEDTEKGVVSQRPSGKMTRIRRVVKEGYVPVQAQEKCQKTTEPLAERFRIERVKPAAFDRILEMQTIDALYFRQEFTQNG